MHAYPAVRTRTPSDFAIHIDGVTKRFGHIVAVDDLSLTVSGVDPLMEREFRRCVSFRDSKPLLDNIPGLSGAESVDADRPRRSSSLRRILIAFGLLDYHRRNLTT